ncbi:MAG: UDP-N-acetylenolpyruvoylglucosamine reductase, partial [Dethiobacteria bacterium]
AEVSIISPGGEQVRLVPEDIVFGYRQSNLSGRGIIVEALLKLEEGDPETLKREVERYHAERRRRHPTLPSAGSVFRNPPGNPAGRLIEAAGGKGLSIGAARVSEKHANFIVNTGGASARDIESLIELIRQRVKDKFGVELETEVRIVGEER